MPLTHGLCITVFYVWDRFHYLAWVHCSWNIFNRVIPCSSIKRLHEPVLTSKFFVSCLCTLCQWCFYNLYDLSNIVPTAKWKLNNPNNLAQIYKEMTFKSGTNAARPMTNEDLLKISRKHVPRRNYLQLIFPSRFETIEVCMDCIEFI